MSRQIISVAILLTLLLGASFAFKQSATKKTGNVSFQASEQTKEKAIITVGSQTFSAEVAKSDVEKAQGLSDRKNLGRDEAMLFVFDQPSKPIFWMKDMLFPLDFIWINEQLKVTEVTRNIPAPQTGTKLEELARYQPKDEIVYVLEVNAGSTLNINVGDIVTLGNSTVL